MKGKKYECCNFCDCRFPRRSPNRRVPSRIRHLNEQHGREIGEEVTLRNYRNYLHYCAEGEGVICEE